ncbi:MAG: gp436 family protein [Thiohalospira sp.]
MAAYCTRSDLAERFGERELLDLTDPYGEHGSIQDGPIDQACQDATGQVDGYLRAAGYTVPLDPVPQLIRAVAADLARAQLYGHQELEHVRKRREAAVQHLKAIARGEVRLDAESREEDSAGAPTFEAGSGTFEKALEKY